MTTTAVLSDLQTAPGVGPRTAQVLRDIGFHTIEDLEGADPEAMYDKLCVVDGAYVDRCVLYVFRCAVYFAENTRHDPELLNWWNWTDDKAESHGTRRREVVGG